MMSFRKLKKELKGFDVCSVAKASGVASSTIYFWLSGYTQEPRDYTYKAVTKVIERELRS